MTLRLPTPALRLHRLVPGLLTLLTGCGPDFAHMAEERLEHARKNTGDIEIVAIERTTPDNFINGVMLAAKLVNKRKNKLIGRTLVINVEQEGDSFEHSNTMINRVISNPRVTAVIGHSSSSIAIPASVMYEQSQTIFMSSFATAKSFTGHNFKYVFRLAPGAKVMAEQSAGVARALNYKKLAVMYGRDHLSREQAFLFEDAAIEQGLRVTKRASFFSNSSNYRPVISEISNEETDAILLVSNASSAATMVKQLREMGYQQPIIGSDSLRRATYPEQAKAAANNTIVPVLYDQHSTNQINQEFIGYYTQEYQTAPDYTAAQGYDAVMLLAAAIERANSTVPPLLATTLHFMPAWVGVTGIHSFDEDGELLGKKYLFEAWQNGEWHTMPVIHVPYLVDRFDRRQIKKYGPSTTRTDFSEVFSKPMSQGQHTSYLLDIAHEMLRFKRIGIIYENTSNGRRNSNYDQLSFLARRKGFKVVECEIPFSILEPDAATSALVACYGKLSQNADALLLAPYRGVPDKTVRQLNGNLNFFKLPSISLDAETEDPNITLVLSKRRDIDTENPENLRVYTTLLNDLKAHEFAANLAGMPEFSINLDAVQGYNLSDDSIINLSPSHYRSVAK